MMEKTNRLYEKIRLEALRQDRLMKSSTDQLNFTVHYHLKLALERIIE